MERRSMRVSFPPICFFLVLGFCYHSTGILVVCKGGAGRSGGFGGTVTGEAFCNRSFSQREMQRVLNRGFSAEGSRCA